MKNIIIFVLELFGKKDVKTTGIKNSFKNKVGLNNGPNREKWIEKTLKDVPKDLKILDAGAGELNNKKYCKHLNYTSQDLCEFSGLGDNRKLVDQKYWDTSKIDIISDITSIPVANDSFDVIICTEVLEHIPKPIKAIKEFKRILKPGGKLIITAPFCSITHQAPYYFSNGYSKYWYNKILSENNFKIKEITPNGNYFDYIAQEIRRIPEVENEYLGTNLSNSIFFKLTKFIMLNFLKNLSNNDKGTDEALCFGFHIIAEKSNV